MFLCGLFPAVLMASLAISRPGSLARLDHSVYDTLVRSVHTRPPSEGVVIVDIDEASLSTVGQWPWPRDVMGHLIAGLRRMGAATVALDIIFAETDRFGRVGDRQATPLTPDDLLARTLREGRVILGYALTFESVPRTQNRCVLHPVGLAVHHPRDETGEPPYFQATGAVCNLPMLAEAAGASGFHQCRARLPTASCRRVPLLAELDGRVYPWLALAAVTATTGSRNLALQISNVNSASLPSTTRRFRSTEGQPPSPLSR